MNKDVNVTRCLLIDDNQNAANGVRHLLAGLGVETDHAAASEEALRYCRTEKPDVVLLAAGKAGSQPADFVRRLRDGRSEKKPVVFLYAETADTQLISQSILLGAADVLMQPFDRDILQFKLRQAGVLA